MLADVGTGGGKGVVLPHQAHGVVIAAGVHQGDVAGDVHARGAHGHAGNGVVEGAEAAVVQDVLLKVLPKAPDAGEDQVGGVDADGAVRCIHDDLGGLFQVPKHPHIRLAVQNFRQHVGQLGQSDAAGHALAAGLGPAQVQRVQCHIHRAQTRRAGGDPAFHISVDLFHHRLGPVRRFHFQSAHISCASFLVSLGTAAKVGSGCTKCLFRIVPNDKTRCKNSFISDKVRRFH